VNRLGAHRGFRQVPAQTAFENRIDFEVLLEFRELCCQCFFQILDIGRIGIPKFSGLPWLKPVRIRCAFEPWLRP